MAKMDKLPKIDLTLLKKLVIELERGLESCDKIKFDENGDQSDFIIEMSKSTGLVTGIMQESSMLIGDIQSIVKASQQLSGTKNTDFFDKVLGGLKGTGGSTN